MIQLFPHNKKAYENAKFILETENRVCIVHPTGTGKSLIIAKFIIENPKARCLFLSPNVFIFKEIKKHIQGNISNVDFQTYQYFLFNDIKLFIDYDYIFLDEFHRVGAPEWNKQIEDLLMFNPKSKIVGTTATHIRYLDDERNMAEELFRGNIASYMDLGTSIEKGIHKKPIYVSALYNIRAIIDDTQYKLERNNRAKELERLKSRRIIWEESSGIDYIIKKYLTPERKKILIFCKSVEHINYVEEVVKPVLSKFYNSKVAYHTVHSTLGTSKTSKIFTAFEHGEIPQIMFVVDMFNEGIHVKGIDTIMMFRDTISPIIYFQQIGRCFSVGQTQNPLIFDFVNNFNIKSSVHSITQNFYNDFEEHNENHYFKKRNLIIDFYDESMDFQKFIKGFSYTKTWEDFYEEVKVFITEHGRLPDVKEIPWISTVRHAYKNNKLSEEEIRLLKELGQNFFEQKVVWDKWDHAFYRFKIFYEANDRVPTGVEMPWVNAQRKAYNREDLSSERVQLIENIVPDFFEGLKLTWEESYELFVNFINKNNRIPTRIEMLWVDAQKTFYRNNKLSEEKVKLIEDVAPNFFKVKQKLNWEDYHKLFADFIMKNNRLPSKTELPWVNLQRNLYKANMLSNKKIKLIEELVPDFFVPENITWYKQYDKLEFFYQKNDRLPKRNEMKWLSLQIQDYKEGKLSKEKIRILESMDADIFIHSSLDAQWEERYNKLKTFKEKYNRLPNRSENTWLHTQKFVFRKGRLSAEQIKLLTNVDSTFTETQSIEDTWMNNYDKLMQFVNENGKLPSSKEYRWLKALRRKYSQNELPEDKIQLLLKVDPNFFERLDRNWHNKLNDFQNFYNTYQRYPRVGIKEEYSIYRWQRVQFRTFKAGKLTEYKIQLLKEVDINFFG
ncbi:TPA: Helicase associated domain protein [Elizabethkingia anophelis]